MDDDKIFDSVREVDLKHTMEQDYIDYAMSVIFVPCAAGCQRWSEASTEKNSLFND